jgi:hypothetical protein
MKRRDRGPGGLRVDYHKGPESPFEESLKAKIPQVGTFQGRKIKKFK